MFNIQSVTNLILSLADTHRSGCYRQKEWPNTRTHIFEITHAKKQKQKRREKQKNTRGGKGKGLGEQRRVDTDSGASKRTLGRSKSNSLNK